jgi:hypothetical protein
MRVPLGENVIESIAPECPSKVLAKSLLRCKSQTRIVRSLEPEATSLPLGENATEVTRSVCPSKVTWIVIVHCS